MAFSGARPGTGQAPAPGDAPYLVTRPWRRAGCCHGDGGNLEVLRQASLAVLFAGHANVAELNRPCGSAKHPCLAHQSWHVMLIAVLFMVGSERVGELEGVLVFVQSAPAISLRGRVMHESWIMHEFAACLSFVVGGFYYS